MRRIKEECDAAGVKVAFEKVSTGFQAAFYRPEAKLDEGGKVVEKVVERLSTNQQRILEVMVKNPVISAKALADVIGISSRKIQDNLAKLKSLGILKRVGPDKGGHWEAVSSAMA